MKTFIINVILAFLLFNSSSFAQEAREARAEDKRNSIKEGLNFIDNFTTGLVRPAKRHLRKNNIELDFLAGILEGYDNNVNLNPDRNKAAFFETSLNTELTYNYTDDIRARMENNTVNTLYYTQTDARLLDIYNKAEWEIDMFEDMCTFGLNYVFDYVYFPCDKDGTYLSNEAGVYMKHNILHNLYHKIGYGLMRKNYSHDKALNGRIVRTDDLREDFRHTWDYELGFYFSDRAIFRTNFEFYSNDSNYQYFDYYDYWSFKVRPTCIFMLTKKLYTSGGLAYQMKRYDDRLSSQDDEHISDDIWSLNLSLLYNLTKSFTAALNLSYRESKSDEPLQRYSGSIITGGLYYSF